MTSSRWKNFRMWRGRLPHWRADGVLYYVTFRHRRALDPDERQILFRALMKPDGRGWNLLVVSVLSEQSDLIATLAESADPDADKLTSLVERAKTRAGKAIVKRTEERFPPFWAESYDRILRDESEQEEFTTQILRAAEDAGEEVTLWLTPSSTDPAP